MKATQVWKKQEVNNLTNDIIYMHWHIFKNGKIVDINWAISDEVRKVLERDSWKYFIDNNIK